MNMIPAMEVAASSEDAKQCSMLHRMERVCAWCGKHLGWVSVTSDQCPVTSNGEPETTHGACEDCVKQMFGELWLGERVRLKDSGVVGQVTEIVMINGRQQLLIALANGSEVGRTVAEVEVI